MKNLENYGVTILRTQEMQKIEGGSWLGDVWRWIKKNLKFKIDHRYGKDWTSH